MGPFLEVLTCKPILVATALQVAIGLTSRLVSGWTDEDTLLNSASDDWGVRLLAQCVTSPELSLLVAGVLSTQMPACETFRQRECGLIKEVLRYLEARQHIGSWLAHAARVSRVSRAGGLAAMRSQVHLTGRPR